MRIGMQRDYSGGFADQVAVIAEYEAAGLDAVFVGKAYSVKEILA